LQPGEESHANRLNGRVVSIQKDRENVKITLDVGGHDRLVSVVSAGQFAALVLKEGDEVTAAIRAKDILIGR
jgi:molybdate transport system regulatory protein